MRTENEIKEHIDLLNGKISSQQSFADKNEGDGHEETRIKAISTMRGIVGGLNWVLNKASVKNRKLIQNEPQKEVSFICCTCGERFDDPILFDIHLNSNVCEETD